MNYENFFKTKKNQPLQKGKDYYTNKKGEVIIKDNAFLPDNQTKGENWALRVLKDQIEDLPTKLKREEDRANEKTFYALIKGNKKEFKNERFKSHYYRALRGNIPENEAYQLAVGSANLDSKDFYNMYLPKDKIKIKRKKK